MWNGPGFDWAGNDERVKATNAARLRALQDPKIAPELLAAGDKNFWGANNAAGNDAADLAMSALRESGANQRQASGQAFEGGENAANREATQGIETLRGRNTLANTELQGRNQAGVANIQGVYGLKERELANAGDLQKQGLISANNLDVAKINTGSAERRVVLENEGNLATTREQNKGRLSEAERQLLQEKFRALGAIGRGSLDLGGGGVAALLEVEQLLGLNRRPVPSHITPGSATTGGVPISQLREDNPGMSDDMIRRKAQARGIVVVEGR